MATASHGYEPTRMTTLESQTTTAIAALASITSTDPAASEAINAVRGLQSTLENGMLPAVSLIRTTDPLGSNGALGWGGRGPGGRDGTWEYVFGTGTVVFVPLEGLAALFPGDDDVTAEEIVDKINEILDQDPSEQQVLELELLVEALEEIADDPELAADVIEEMGAEGVNDFYGRLHDLGFPYPLHETPDHPHLDPDLRAVIEAFGLVVSQGVKRPSAAAVISEAIEIAENYPTVRGISPLIGLTQAEDLPPELADQLLEALQDLADRDLHYDPMSPTNVAFPGLPFDVAGYVVILFDSNPDLVTRHIADENGFVPGGEDLLGDLIETKVRDGVVTGDVEDALANVITQIIDQTPMDVLIVEEDGATTGEGVLFDLVAVLIEHDFKVGGLGVIEALAPHLPIITGAYPGSETPLTQSEIDSLYVDLFEDLTNDEIEAGLALIIAGASNRIADFNPEDFAEDTNVAVRLGKLLDGVLNPATRAIESIVDGRENEIGIIERAFNQAFGLLPIPGNSVVRLAMKEVVKKIIDEGFEADDSPLDIAGAMELIAVETTMITLHANDELRDEVVRVALDHWDNTAGRLRTSHPGAGGSARIEEIRQELEASQRPGGPPISYETFRDLPEMLDLITQLEDELTD